MNRNLANSTNESAQFTTDADALILNFLASHLKFDLPDKPTEREGDVKPPLYAATALLSERKLGGGGGGGGKTRGGSATITKESRLRLLGNFGLFLK